MQQPSLKKNYLYRSLYEILILITPFITTPYVSRVLGPDGVGIYSYTQSIITYFMLFGALGTVSYGAREIAQARDDINKSSKLFWEIELMTVMTSTACLVVWIGIIIFSTQYRYYYIALTPFLLSTMFDISWYFTGLEEVGKTVIRNAIVKVLSIVLLFLLVNKKEDVIVYCIINSLTVLLGNLSMWLYLPKMLVKVETKQLQFKHHFHETLIYFIPTIAISIYTVLDKTLIGLITGSSFQNGYYEQATKIIKIVKSLVFVALNSVMGARLSYLFSEGKIDEIKKRINQSMDFIYLLAYGSMFGLISIARNFVPLFFGDGYDPVIHLLFLMAPLVLIIGTSNCLGGQYYTPSGQRKKSAKVIVEGAIINLFANLLLIPRFGAYGATVASVIAETIIAIIYVNKSNGFMTWNTIWAFSYKRIIAGIIMCCCVYAVGIHTISSPIVTVVFQFCVGVGVYSGILYILKDTMLFELIEIIKRMLIRIRKKTLGT